jgi:uncharacterized membrane protein
MEMSPAAGKILGMVMAYGVSSLGLLLAYINYRKRTLKADTVFTPRARAVVVGVVTVAVVATVLTAAAASSRAGAPASWHLGIALPAAIVLVSVILTWILYRHFARLVERSGPDSGSGS